jgi:pimeloyl-ACP methyl ester carboxylesterase
VRTAFVDAAGTRLCVYEWGEPGRPAILYWDGLGGTGLHANEVGPLLASAGFRVVAPDPPGHARSPAVALEDYRPSRLAALAADLLAALRIERITFLGFSWGADVGCAFAARRPDLTERLVLVDGGYVDYADLSGFDLGADLEACVERARARAGRRSFPSWGAYFASERDDLGRWNPALEAAHRETMREQDGAVVPVLSPESVGAIHHAGLVEPTVSTYPALRAAGLPILLLVPADGVAGSAVAPGCLERFAEQVPQLAIRELPGAVHDLVSVAPGELAATISSWIEGSSARPSK